MIDLTQFINQHVIYRSASMFLPDIEAQDGALSDAIRGKSLLVIGGAGSIGSSFIRAVLPYEPAELYVVDTNENALTELTQSLRSTEIYMPSVYKTYPMDYASPVFCKMFRQHRREAANGDAFEAKEGDASAQRGSNSETSRGVIHGFDIVANFSAHKHVRSEKDIYSIEALLRNNVINAMALLELLKEHPPELYFCVSTDKAANPVNIMGASKRIMEDLIFAYSDAFPVKTARFANVAFSQGSLPDGFLHRLQMRQPLTAPADVRRFFGMTGMPSVCGESPRGAWLPTNPIATPKAYTVRCRREEGMA
ncbi:MAG: polysaccharide biosynthesis protein, partial [Lachnospiraceae bacterium]|nr:polysaccharide biosynthesis protein [Lachnospiraceae bacterium]